MCSVSCTQLIVKNMIFEQIRPNFSFKKDSLCPDCLNTFFFSCSFLPPFTLPSSLPMYVIFEVGYLWAYLYYKHPTAPETSYDIFHTPLLHLTLSVSVLKACLYSCDMGPCVVDKANEPLRRGAALRPPGPSDTHQLKDLDTMAGHV